MRIFSSSSIALVFLLLIGAFVEIPTANALSRPAGYVEPPHYRERVKIRFHRSVISELRDKKRTLRDNSGTSHGTPAFARPYTPQPSTNSNVTRRIHKIDRNIEKRKRKIQRLRRQIQR